MSPGGVFTLDMEDAPNGMGRRAKTSCRRLSFWVLAARRVPASGVKSGGAHQRLPDGDAREAQLHSRHLASQEASQSIVVTAGVGFSAPAVFQKFGQGGNHKK